MIKLLFDQNLSWRLAEELSELYPGSAHVRTLELDRSPDEEVWQRAQREDFVIVSKDSDFEQRSLLRGHPPKCIWLRVGNCSTQDIVTLLRKHVGLIEEFGQRETESYMILP